MTVLRNVLNKAVDDQWINRLPTENLRPLKWTPKKRDLVSNEQIQKLCEIALAPHKDEHTEFEVQRINGQQLADYLKLLAYSGARRNEALRLRWLDVDWKNRQLTVGADGQTKNREARAVS